MPRRYREHYTGQYTTEDEEILSQLCSHHPLGACNKDCWEEIGRIFNETVSSGHKRSWPGLRKRFKDYLGPWKCHIETKTKAQREPRPAQQRMYALSRFINE